MPLTFPVDQSKTDFIPQGNLTFYLAVGESTYLATWLTSYILLRLGQGMCKSDVFLPAVFKYVWFNHLCVKGNTFGHTSLQAKGLSCQYWRGHNIT